MKKDDYLNARCNCREREKCPLSANCFIDNFIYEGTERKGVNNDDDDDGEMIYIEIKS